MVTTGAQVDALVDWGELDGLEADADAECGEEEEAEEEEEEDEEDEGAATETFAFDVSEAVPADPISPQALVTRSTPAMPSPSVTADQRPCTTAAEHLLLSTRSPFYADNASDIDTVSRT